MELDNILQSNAEIAFAIFGVTQMFKMSSVVSSRFLPFIAVLCGIIFVMGRDGITFNSFLYGLVIGLASTGVVNRVDSYLKPKAETQNIQILNTETTNGQTLPINPNQ